MAGFIHEYPSPFPNPFPYPIPNPYPDPNPNPNPNNPWEYGGYFTDLEIAVEARKQAEQEYW